MWCKIHFDIFSHLRVEHECNERTDGRTEVLLAINSAVYRPALKSLKFPNFMTYSIFVKVLKNPLQENLYLSLNEKQIVDCTVVYILQFCRYFYIENWPSMDGMFML